MKSRTISPNGAFAIHFRWAGSPNSPEVPVHWLFPFQGLRPAFDVCNLLTRVLCSYSMPSTTWPAILSVHFSPSNPLHPCITSSQILGTMAKVAHATAIDPTKGARIPVRISKDLLRDDASPRKRQKIAVQCRFASRMKHPAVR